MGDWKSVRRGKRKSSEGRWGIYLILASHLFRDVVKASSMHPVKSAYGQNIVLENIGNYQACHTNRLLHD